jgi:membrane protein insertase Oxa1/YidC/SpoIIIJ
VWAKEAQANVQALALYWTTSMVFTMAQNALLDKMDERRKASRPVTDGA